MITMISKLPNDVQFVVLISISLFLVYNAYCYGPVSRYAYEDYIYDRYILEEWFCQAHPNWKDEGTHEWKELENLNEERLERLCWNFLGSLNMTKLIVPVYERFKLKPPSRPDKETVLREKVFHRVPIKIRHFMQNVTCYGTVLRCDFNTTDIYLTDYNGTHVFKLRKDPRDNQYYVQTGVHKLNFEAVKHLSS